MGFHNILKSGGTLADSIFYPRLKGLGKKTLELITLTYYHPFRQKAVAGLF